MDIFVGSLPFKLDEGELRALFENLGEVTSVKIIIDKDTRQNKGFGFVEMPNESEAQKAIEELNGFEIMGRKIVVNEAQKRDRDSPPKFRDENKRSGGFRSGGNGGGGNGGYNKGGFGNDRDKKRW
jgi:RNA recognition motif-containing protein